MTRGRRAVGPPGASSPRLTVALVRGFRGLRGHVRVELLTDRPEDRFTVGARLFPEGAGEHLTIAEATPVADGPGWWLRFSEIGDRALAEARLRDRYLEIDDPHEAREPGRWPWSELLGIAVTSTTGEAMGEVVDIYRAGGAEVFLVRGARGEVDVPGVREIVTELAPERAVMVVDLERLALDARPVEDEGYVRPRDRRPHKKPRRRASATGAPPQPAPGHAQAPAPGEATAAPADEAPAAAPRPAAGPEPDA